MHMRLHLRLRQCVPHAVCIFCLLRPLWGWMDRKAEEPSSNPAAMREDGEPSKREANVLGDMLAPKVSPAAAQARGAANE